MEVAAQRFVARRLVRGGLIATTDKGETWKRIGEVKDAQYGPIFGRSAKHMFVLTKAGPVESTDGGVTWSPPLAPPAEMKGIGGLSWLEYDPRTDTLYLMKMGSELYRLTRAADPRDTTSVQGNWAPVKAE